MIWLNPDGIARRFDYDLYPHRFKVCLEKIETLHQPSLLSLGLVDNSPQLSGTLVCPLRLLELTVRWKRPFGLFQRVLPILGLRHPSYECVLL